MEITQKTVEYVANLARIDLEPGELQSLSVQLKDILHFIDSLSKLDIIGVEPTSHILPLSNVLRDDIAKDSLPADKALECAPQKRDAFFGVPKVIE